MIDYKTLSDEWTAAEASYLEKNNHAVYYDKQHDNKMKEEYYREIDFENKNLNTNINRLLVKTHTTQLKYSPHRYVYPWVDLQENKKLKSLYSGNSMDPLKTIEQDIMLLKNGNASSVNNMPFNCEHVIPQSWFNEKEPMRGDLHHLFACEPACNSMRSNYPYFDFLSYSPDLQSNKIREDCGMMENEKFEPEYGKGIVARAVFYFSIRYERETNIEDRMDMGLLLKWHKKYPVTIYEKHRNAAIFELQGNRNPFIDFPEQAEMLISIK